MSAFPSPVDIAIEKHDKPYYGMDNESEVDLLLRHASSLVIAIKHTNMNSGFLDTGVMKKVSH